MIAGRVASGAWPLVLPASAPRCRWSRARSGSRRWPRALWSGRTASSYATAAVLWRPRRCDDRRGRTSRSPRVAEPAVDVTLSVHRAGDLLPADIGRRGPIAVTSALRTAIDLAAVVDVDGLEIAIESALRRRLFSVGQLRWRADALMGTGRRGSSASARAPRAARPRSTDSGWEVRTAQVLIAAGFRRADASVLRAPSREGDRARRPRLPGANADPRVRQRPVALRYVHAATSDAARRNRLRTSGWTVARGHARDPAPTRSRLVRDSERSSSRSEGQVGGAARRNSRRWRIS